ncbi:MAG: DinB family protein [Bacteroidota bacterium]
MQIEHAIKNVFAQLSDALAQLTDAQYRQPSKILFSATIGQHVRHVIELFLCLENGYATGVVNYEKRKRDHRIETDRFLARDLLEQITQLLNKTEKSLLLEVSYDEVSDKTTKIPTNFSRELVYNLEHTVHHMALIRVGISELSVIALPDSFGVASSTIKYREACAQ